jgi:signal peptidase
MKYVSLSGLVMTVVNGTEVYATSELSLIRYPHTLDVKKETRNTLIAAGIVAAVFVTAYASVIMYAGTSTPFYTVESGSMMHSDRSKIGIIDTGDMVLVRDPSKVNITTYVEGHSTGYGKFGDYGDVIIYKDGSRTIIHRAMAYVEYDPGTNKWTVRGVTGTFSGIFECDEFSVNLDALTHGSGYITKGDNNIPNDNGLVTDNMIIAVAAYEVPWLGCIKLFLTNSGSDIPMNSVWSLMITIIVIILAVVGASILYDRLTKKKG